MIIVTGGAGFIGANILKALNALGRTDIVVVDDLTDGKKFQNLAIARFQDYLDQDDFLARIVDNQCFSSTIDAVLHQGACSVTTEWNGRYMMKNNYEYSKKLLHYCKERKIPFIYASSAAVYGGNEQFSEAMTQQMPLNVYGYSKWLFDQYVLSQLPSMQSLVVGLRYFNVYGPHEQHKANMASVAFHFMNQLQTNGVVKLFEGSHGYADGEQRRDFVYVDDVVKVNLWFMQQAKQTQYSGIYNVGTGCARSFNDLARQLIALHGSGNIQYIPFPEQLQGAYQSFTEADISRLRSIGYMEPFQSLEQGLEQYYTLRYHQTNTALI